MKNITSRYEQGWTYNWQGSEFGGMMSYSLILTHPAVKSNILHTYETLSDALNAPGPQSLVPQDVMQKALADYPEQRPEQKMRAA